MCIILFTYCGYVILPKLQYLYLTNRPCSATIAMTEVGGTSELNLDYFGPVDEYSSDSENDTPLPG